MMRRWSLLAALPLALAGCGVDLSPLPEGLAVRRSDSADFEAARLRLQLVWSFDRAGWETAVKYLSDPNERLALAAARSAGRWAVRRHAAATQQAVDALAAALTRESRPAVVAAQAASVVNLLANRQGLPGGPVDPARALGALRTLAGSGRGDDGLASARKLSADFLNAWALPRRAKLGENVYDGPGWSASPPPKAPARRRVRPYRQRVHTVPVVAAGEVRLGDLDGDGGTDYLIIDRAGRPDGLHIRMTVYDHDDSMVWSQTLIGDDRPVSMPPGELADLDGDGRAEILYVDRAGRVVVRDGTGVVVRRPEPYRTLDGAPYFGSGPGGAGRVWLANLRGEGRRDLLLASDSNLLALNGQFQLLWHVCLEVYGRADEPMLLADLDGDGRDEIIRGRVALDDDGRVLWTWPRRAGCGVVGELLSGQQSRQAVLVGPAGTVAGFDPGGLLWEVDGPGGVRGLLVGRFRGALAGRFVGLICGDEGRPDRRWQTGRLVDGLGAFDRGSLRRAGGADSPAVELHAAGLVSDWDRDGVDEVWGHERGDPLGITGWFKYPSGPAVRKIHVEGPLLGLADVDGDGRDELLYFQGKSLVIQRN